MRQLSPVVWSKGVFLSPQHLQAQDRFFEDALHFSTEALTPYPRGWIALETDAAALAAGQFALARAAGLFPDGLTLDAPGADSLPRSRPLEECFRDGRKRCVFYLAAPEHRPGGINIGAHRGAGAGARYFAELQMLRDENGGASAEKPVSLARKNLQILAEGENLEGSAVLPLAAVEQTEAGSYRLDATFVPPLLDFKASVYLAGILRALIELLVARTGQLAGARRERNQSLADFSASDIANFWLLYTLNGGLPVLRHMMEAHRAHPEAVFIEMLRLAGALTTFSPKFAARDLPRYDHDQPGACFGLLDALLRELLETVAPSNFVALRLKPVRDSIYAAAIDQDRYFEGSRFYLAVAAEMKEGDLIGRAPRLLKAASATQVEPLVRQALPGLRLTHVASPPRAIPVKLRYQYFSVEKGGPLWDSVQRARNFAVYAPGEIPNPEMELIILLSQPE
jgi:type VI secretion system protein ImpJ